MCVRLAWSAETVGQAADRSRLCPVYLIIPQLVLTSLPYCNELCTHSLQPFNHAYLLMVGLPPWNIRRSSDKPSDGRAITGALPQRQPS